MPSYLYYVGSDANLVARFWAKVRKGPDCWEWAGRRDKDGYGQFWLEGSTKRAHRVSWFFHKGYWPASHVLHKCDNPSCVRPEHLCVGSDADNAKDCVVKGRQSRGTINGNAKLTEDAVRTIRSSTRPARVLGGLFNITPETVWRIKSRKSWAHVQEKPT
jgi:hypothetical protein